MCCDICPYFDECEELDELQEECCHECPDFAGCQDKDEEAAEESREGSEV